MASARWSAAGEQQQSTCEGTATAGRYRRTRSVLSRILCSCRRQVTLPCCPTAWVICEELTNALRHGVDDYWLINCSNVKPHAYLLDCIAQLWQSGTADPEVTASLMHRLTTAKPMPCPWQNALPDMRTMPYRGDTRTTGCGDQFYNHVPRMLITQFLRDRTQPEART